MAQSIGSLARAIAPPVGGLLYDFGPSWPYWAGGLMLVAGGLFALWIRPAQERAILERGVEMREHGKHG